MRRQCIFCLGSNSKKRKVEANTVFNLEKKLLGIDNPYTSKGVCEDCLNHFLGHFPSSNEPTLYKISLRGFYEEHLKIKEGFKPIWFLSKPLKLFLASGSRGNGSFEFSFYWLRKVYGLNKMERTEIPASIKKLLPNQCEVCGNNQNLEIHHKIPLCFGGSNEKENLRVLCERCHKKLDWESPVSFDLAKKLKEILEKEYGSKILCYELKMHSSSK